MQTAIDNLPKSPTGVAGLDEVTGGGLPQGRTTLICGDAGAGKTLLGLTFLANGASQCEEPGVFITFEESDNELITNMASIGVDLSSLIAENKLAIDHIHLEPNQVGGAYDLDGLFIRLDFAIKQVNAKRIVLDSIDLLFTTLPQPMLIRDEIRRLLRWLKNKAVTVIITGESGPNGLTRNSMEEYVADCVITLENRVARQSSIRLLRIVKYRGSAHGTNEYPFLIGDKSITMLPCTSPDMDPPALTQRISSGVPRLDAMLGGQGYYRASVIMISGPPGSGKSNISAKFAQACCARNERCLYFLLEESRNQVIRNMRSIGIDLEKLEKEGLLQFTSLRPTLWGVERHLAMFREAISQFKPQTVIFDPISALHNVEDMFALKTMLVRLVNALRMEQITTQFISLSTEETSAEYARIGIASLIDTWIQLRDIEGDGERNRIIQVLKSRGMAHSNQMREFIINDNGIDLVDVYPGISGALTGSARIARLAEDEQLALLSHQRITRREQELEQRRALKDARVKALEAEFLVNAAEQQRLNEIDRRREMREAGVVQRMALSRQSDTAPSTDDAAAATGAATALRTE
jgi:circadian clock protein KaiC